MTQKEKRINIEKTKDEVISIYDENDNYVGKDTRINMRKNNLIHRCTTILILNERNEILVQTRALSKEYCPGYLSAVSGGVLCDGESVELNAFKELDEELGIDLNKTKYKLQFLRKYFFEEKYCRCWVYEYYIRITDDESKNITFKDREVACVDWYSKDELLKIYEDPESKITPAGKEIIKELEDIHIL
jgi:isopentenyldiphosphate isomerase